MSDNLGVLLIHSDTTDGSTTFEDSSPSGHTITPVNCTHEDTQKKFGDTSIYFNGTGGLTLDTSTDFELDGDFTIDYWMYPTGTGSLGFTNYVTVNRFQALYMTSASAGVMSINGGSNISLSFTANAWQHYALVRSGSTITAYVNGVSQGTYTYSSTIGASSHNYIGRSENSGHYSHGYIDELRVVKGTAIWTSDFTPPTAPYAASGGTALSDMAMDIKAWQEKTDNIPLDIHVAAWAAEDTKLDIHAAYQALADIPLNIDTLGLILKDHKLDISAGSLGIKDVPLNIQLSKEQLKNALLDIYLSDGIITQNALLDIVLGDGNNITDMGMDLMTIQTLPVFKSVYAMNLNSVIKEV